MDPRYASTGGHPVMNEILILNVALKSLDETVVSVREQLINEYSLKRNTRSFLKFKRANPIAYRNFLITVKLVHSELIENNKNLQIKARRRLRINRL